MRTRTALSLATFALLASGTLAGREAHAGSMDPTPERLVLQPPNLPAGLAGQTCQSIAANPEIVVQQGGPENQLPNKFTCKGDNAAFRNYVSELGFAIAPTAFHPARTTGLGGFALTFDASYTKINANGTTKDGLAYWKKGTQGDVNADSKSYPKENATPDSVLQIYSLKARKGLPFGFELVGALGFIANSTLWVGGADIRWSLMEGFRTGPLGYFPDVSLGGGVRTLTGTSKFHLTTVGMDAQISKGITLADSAVLTPYVGYQRLIIFGDAIILDATPNTDALQQCGYVGPDPSTGSPVCRHALSNGAPNNGDFNNNFTFERVRIHRHRGILGVNYRYEILFLASQFLMDLTPPSAENSDVSSNRQWTLSLEAGVFF